MRGHALEYAACTMQYTVNTTRVCAAQHVSPLAKECPHSTQTPLTGTTRLQQQIDSASDFAMTMCVMTTTVSRDEFCSRLEPGTLQNLHCKVFPIETSIAPPHAAAAAAATVALRRVHT